MFFSPIFCLSRTLEIFRRCRDDENQTSHAACSNSRFLDFFRSHRACGLIRDPVFAACNETVNTTVHEMSCEKALCSNKAFLETLETTMMGYVAECAFRGSITPSGIRPSAGIGKGMSKYCLQVPTKMIRICFNMSARLEHWQNE